MRKSRPAVRVVQALTDPIHGPLTITFVSSARRETMHRRRDAMNVCFIASILSIAGARADVRVDLLGQWGGSTHAIKVRDGLAYVGIGPRLAILDVHDPTNPVHVGQSEPLGYYVVDIAVDGSFAYVVTYHAGFRIIDIADPTNPRLVSSYSFSTDDTAVAVD